MKPGRRKLAGRFSLRAPIAMACLLAFAVGGCDQPLPSPKQKGQAPKADTTKQPLQSVYRKALENYHAQGVSQIEQALACVQNLQRNLPDFLKTPDDKGLADLLAMARHCHKIYQPALALTASYSALDARLTSLRKRIDSRPITASYVDYLDGAPTAGIPNDPAQPLDRESLIAEQGLTDQADVVLGFEVLLFLLEGEHRYHPQLPLRTAEDYAAVNEWPDQPNGETLPASFHPKNRRRLYLQRVIEILEINLGLLRDSWKTFVYPTSQDEAQALAFTCVRNWHSVEVSLAADDIGEVTDRLMPLLISNDNNDIAHLLKLDSLEGWPKDGAPVDPAILAQSLGQWLVQHNR